MIQEAMFKLVTDAVSLTGGFYPNAVDLGAQAPFGRYIVLSDDDRLSHGGTSNLFEARIQIDIWHNTYDSMKTLRKAIFDALQGYSGTPSGSEVDIQVVQVTSMVDAPDTDLDLFGGVINVRTQYKHV